MHRGCSAALTLTSYRSFVVGLCSLALTAVVAGPSWAGGLYVNEFGAPSTGVAGAGATAVASDPSTAFHNPAGMTRLKGTQLMLTGGAIYSTVKFDPAPNTPIPGGDGGDAGGLAPLLGSFVVHSLTDDLKLGASLISITGAVLDYDDGWTGRFLSQEVKLLSVAFTPTVAYRLNKWLSFGAGFSVMYANLEMTLAAPPPVGTGQVKIDGDDFAYGFNLGTLVELSEQTRLGIAYFSEIEPNFSGDVEINPLGLSAATETSFPLPQYVKIGLYHEFNDQFAVLGTVHWEDWSQLENITISTGSGSVNIPRNWIDTWKFGGGVHFRPSKPWLLQAGFSYDTSPVGESDRTPDMPIDRQLRYAVGTQYQWSEKVSVGGAFEYLDYGKAEINKPLLLRGKYEKNNIVFVALNANWKF